MDTSAHFRNIRPGAMPLWRMREIALGIIRAAVVYRRAHLNRLPIIHSDVRVRIQHGLIELGHFSEMHERVVLSAIGSSPSQPARVTIGDYTSIWYGTVISARHEIVIGPQCVISWNCTVIDNDMHEIIYPEGTTSDQTEGAPVRIGNHVWLGASVIVLKGVSIGENSIVAAGAIVTQDVPPNTLVAGIPAKPIRQVAGWR